MLNLLDDYFNVHNTFQLVVSASPTSASVLVGDYQLFSGDNTVYATQQTLSLVRAGETVSFYNINELAKPTDTAVIASITKITNPTLLALLPAARAAAAKKAEKTPCSACSAGFHPYFSAQLYNITFIDPLSPQVKPLTLLNADNISNVGASVVDSEFTGSNSNLGRFKSSGGKLLRNTFHRGPTHQNLEIECLQNWDEGMLGIHDVEISGNTFYGTNASPVHIFGAVGVVQSNNTFIP